MRAHTSGMVNAPGAYVRDAVEEETRDGPRALGEVIRRVGQRIEGMRGAFHEDASGVLSEYRTWRSDVLRFGEDTRIDRIAERRGAAGTHDTVSRTTTLDVCALEDEHRAYWDRVLAHEKKGHGTHPATFNRQSVMHDGTEVPLVALVEWYAITEARQPDSDLTPSYMEYKRAGERIARVIGEGTLRSSIRAGDVQSVHDRLEAHRLREQLGLPYGTEIGYG